MNIPKCAATASAVKENIQKVIIGKSEVIDCMLASLIAGGHVLLEDVPGTGKTVLAKSLAKSISGHFSRVQFTPDLMPSDVTGLYFYNQKESEFTFRPGPVFCNLLLADEINRATPRTQSALLECMEEKQVTIDGKTHPLNPPFFVIATENPVETTGTFPLPEAQLDRFLMKLSMGLPTETEELQILNRFVADQPLTTLESVCTQEELLEMQQTCPQIYVHPAVMQYIVALVQATRSDRSLITGVSPRGSLALLRSCQAYAMIAGRDYVVPEDVKALAVPVLAHRLVTGHAAGSIHRPEQMIAQLLDQVPVPTETEFSRKG